MSGWNKELVAKILSVLLTALIALLAAFGYDVQVVQPRVAEQIQAAGLPAATLPASRGVTGFDDLAVASVTAAGDIAAGGRLLHASTAVTLTAGMTVTPATDFYVISSTGAVSMTLAAPAGTGQVLYLYGDDNNTVTVNDTNIYTTDGNAVTFGQYDIVEFVAVGNKWVHVAKSANS